MNISPIAAFSDNYIWCLEQNNKVWLVDPGCADAVKHYLHTHKFELAGILITHHHADHTGGIAALTSDRDIPVVGPSNCTSKGVNTVISRGETVDVLGYPFVCFEIPGHTLDHIAFYNEQLAVVFCGDTLFAGGCGRIFEGDATMMWQSLSLLAALPADTQVYCAHEYTLANLTFANAVDGDNIDLQQRIATAKQLREKDVPTVPTTIALELKTNPFLRANHAVLKRSAEQSSQQQLFTDVDVFRELRAYKDRF